MGGSYQLYYITDRKAFPGDESARRKRLLEKIEEAARAGVDLIQLREKDLPIRDLEGLARDVQQTVERVARETPNPATCLLINSRLDVALAVGAGGVHLRSDDISARDARAVADNFFSRNRKLDTRTFVVGVSCHRLDEIRRAEEQAADFAVLAPVFEKKDAPQAGAVGLEVLREACRGKLPVFALGGVTAENARACIDAGATGIAAIRLFQENPIAELLKRLRR